MPAYESKIHNEATDMLVKALLSLESEEECYRFLEDICTYKELLDLAQRLQVAGMLRRKVTYNDIVRETGMSTATISRVNKCLIYGEGGYK
ncbi:MAG: YerC/YecD family TrpR-related protein, partial [Eubacteriales bacterium]|nr:YerC/YecD family TrpR-related protein [Eubacteriales bacterium]